jgi:hypothetical protein
MLTDTECKNVKYEGKPKKISDSGGLYLLVTSTAKLWQMAYRLAASKKQRRSANITGRPKEVSPSPPRVSSAMKRRSCSPMASIQARKKEAKRLPPVKPTFREIAKDWYDIKVIAEGLGESVQESTTRRMKVLNATLGDMEAIKIEPPDVLRAISAIQKRGKHTEANLTRGVASRIFLYGIPHGYCVRNPAADLSGAMTSPISKPRPAFTEPVTFGALLRDIQKYRGWYGNIVGLALQLLPLVATRPYKEFCLGEWTEIKFDKALSLRKE